ncbi:hypothetical protein [Rhodoferax sp. UBA5149]|uniref:hypothetical protein n=1 Tax=Rhodoferax sp. UBA5149 TaxID=1947379 RepID=UPI0025D6063F|nr:hypothetical protein [Rhodoferax sp. UBA5149]
MATDTVNDANTTGLQIAIEGLSKFLARLDDKGRSIADAALSHFANHPDDHEWAASTIKHQVVLRAMETSEPAHILKFKPSKSRKVSAPKAG